MQFSKKAITSLFILLLGGIFLSSCDLGNNKSYESELNSALNELSETKANIDSTIATLLQQQANEKATLELQIYSLQEELKIMQSESNNSKENYEARISELNQIISSKEQEISDLESSYQAQIDELLKVNYYTITFDCNGGNPLESIIYANNAPLNNLPTPTHTSSTFLGWYYNGELVDANTLYTYGKDITLVAKWKGGDDLFVYEIINNEVVIKGYFGTDVDVVIPETIGGYGVTTLTASTFAGNTTIESVAIPSSVTIIEDGLLNGCSSISKLTISDTINTTLQRMFGYSSLLPDNFDTIEFNTYSSWPSDFFIGFFKEYNIILPSSLKDLPSFENNKLIKGITLPNGITEIKKATFFGCLYLENIEMPEDIVSIGDNAFQYCSSLVNINIPESVTSIGKEAFYYCKSLANIKIPNNVVSIGYRTFAGCNNLTNMTIPESVTSLGVGAFDGCSSLEKIVLHKSVTSINRYAFRGCDNLTIYCEAESQPASWDSEWNSDDRPVVWGYKESN